MQHQAITDLDHHNLAGLYLVSAFLAMEPIDSLLSLARECGGGLITDEVQRFIWENCISKVDCEKVHVPYIRNFIKKVITEVESAGSDVLDELYEGFSHYLCSLKDAIPGEGNAWIVKYISFIFHDGASRLVVSLRCSLNMLDGDTGCFLWPSSLFMSEFILSHPELFANKSCFEVGSGVGLVGICLDHVNASEVILTDGDLSTLSNLKFNLKMNQSRETDLVQCIHLPWESTEYNQIQEFMPNVVLGADIIYDPSCLPHLVELLYSLLQRRETRNHLRENNVGERHASVRCTNGDYDEAKDLAHSCSNGSHVVMPRLEAADAEVLSRALDSGPVAFISCVVRNISTFEYFIDLVRRASLVVRDLTETIRPAKLLPYMKSYPRSDVKMLLISRSQPR